jgi:hypothetical protein
MERSQADVLLVLVLGQACHSVEEYVFRLWEVFAPARAVAQAVDADAALGFILSNSLLVGFGLWCWAVPVRREWKAASALMWGWGLLETANGFGHIALAAAARGYFPGLYTAPLLIAAGLWLVSRLHARNA